MKRFIVLSIVLLMLAGFAITSSAMEVDLVVGRELITVGTLTVTESSSDLVVKYTITDSEWELLETHLYVGYTNPEELTSAPGQFPYSEEHDPAVLTVTYIIEISEIDSYKLKGGKKWVVDDIAVPVDPIYYIAAHAEIGKIDEFGDPVLVDPEDIDSEQIEETTWAYGVDEIRSGKNWAMYFTFPVE